MTIIDGLPSFHKERHDLFKRVLWDLAVTLPCDNLRYDGDIDKPNWYTILDDGQYLTLHLDRFLLSHSRPRDTSQSRKVWRGAPAEPFTLHQPIDYLYAYLRTDNGSRYAPSYTRLLQEYGDDMLASCEQIHQGVLWHFKHGRKPQLDPVPDGVLLNDPRMRLFNGVSSHMGLCQMMSRLAKASDAYILLDDEAANLMRWAAMNTIKRLWSKATDPSTSICRLIPLRLTMRNPYLYPAQGGT
jgi:hypothetical protein